MPFRVIMRGAGVPAHIMRVLPLVSPVRAAGPLASQIQIPVGTIDRQSNTLILGMVGGEVIYVFNNEMRAAPIGVFVQGYFIGQVTSEVYRRTAWIIPVSQVVMAFSMGVVIGYAGIAGAAANVVVVLVRIGVFLERHPNEVRVVRETLPVVVRSLRWFRGNCPILYRKMSAVVSRGLWEAIMSAPDGIRAEDIASVLGRILGGVSGAPEAGLRVLAGIIARTVLIYSALHLAPAAAHSSAHHARQIADEMVTALRAQGAAITEAEREQIAREIVSAGQAAGTNIDQLNGALQRLSPALDRLIRDFGEHR